MVRSRGDAAAHVHHDQVETVIGPSELPGDIAGYGLLVQRVEHASALHPGKPRESGNRPEFVKDGRIHDVGRGAVALRHDPRKYTTEVRRVKVQPGKTMLRQVTVNGIQAVGKLVHNRRKAVDLRARVFDARLDGASLMQHADLR